MRDAATENQLLEVGGCLSIDGLMDKQAAREFNTLTA